MMMKSTVVVVMVVVIAMLAVAGAHGRRRKHKFTQKTYEVRVDPSEAVMDSSTCAKRCEKEDMNRKAKVFKCTAFYTGATTNQCFLFVYHCQKKGAFKKPTDLFECADCLYKAPKRKWKRKGGKSSWRSKGRKGKKTAKKAQEYNLGP